MSDLIARLQAADGPSRFWSKVDISGADGCWEWKASKNRKGYGQFSVGGRANNDHQSLKAHRVAFMLVRGPIPNGKQLDHLCYNTACCNPHHLEPVTAAENIRRARARKTHCKRGHEYTKENTIITGEGARDCRACRNMRKRKYWRAKKEAAALKAAE